MHIQKQSSVDSAELGRRAEELIKAASNRYRIVVQVANRAKRRRYEDFDNIDEQMMKPVLRAIVEMSDELMQPEIISDVRTSINR
jgi:DNA-directed RNA polymerase subunit omega